MSAIPSFEKINYSLRTNKNIERKLVFDKLRALASRVPMTGHRYVGFGSLWFVDYVLAHRQLGIDSMLSIEIEADGARRAEFNKPYRGIEIRQGKSTDVLGAFLPTEWQTPLVAWFDYDGVLDETVVADCERVMQSAASNSIVVITINAERDSYRPRLLAGPGRQSSIETLEPLVGSALDKSTVIGAGRDIFPADFRGALGNTMLAFLAQTLQATGRATRGVPFVFVPLFDIAHADGATMLTVGGAVIDPDDLAPWQDYFGMPKADLISGRAVSRHMIDLKPITLREKVEIDRLLPGDEASVTAAAAANGIGLPPSEIRKYLQWYQRVPVFSEAII